KQLLSADIIDGVKGMLANLAQAVEAHELPEGDQMLLPLMSGQLAEAMLGGTTKQDRTTKPLRSPLEQAREAATSLGRLRHRQGYEIQEVVYEYVKLRQEVWDALRADPGVEPTLSPGVLIYLDRLIDELMLTTVENFYHTSM